MGLCVLDADGRRERDTRSIIFPPRKCVCDLLVSYVEMFAPRYAVNDLGVVLVDLNPTHENVRDRVPHALRMHLAPRNSENPGKTMHAAFVSIAVGEKSVLLGKKSYFVKERPPDHGGEIDNSPGRYLIRHDDT